jgi:hypothetical protein
MNGTLTQKGHEMSMNFNHLTAQTTLSGESLVREINRSILSIQNTTKSTQSRYKTWTMQAKAPQRSGSGETPMATMFEMTLMSCLVHALFGLPMMQGLGLADQTVDALGYVAGGAHHSLADGRFAPRTVRGPGAHMMALEQHRVQNALSSQKDKVGELLSMKEMIMALLILMLAGETKGDSGKGGEDMLAPDVLRHPKLARFKQNRHSLDCIRSMFQEQAAAKTAARLPTLRCA